jgi:DNA-binding NtrC family response regulator
MTLFNFVALEAQHNLIKSTLKKTKYNMSKTAQVLKIDRKTLYNKIQKFNKHKGKHIKAIEASASS